uniref:ZSWIM1/3 RNaseH-like domain-containing protein n=1 Tax=Branchiostoma floridae TaxID=7739 RepID=C3Y8N7_BRAFL|eukprot:XP_002607464.1 hypothetical protein BRAFLDRAFT_69896 [Branchiostoma floridae]
MARVKQYMPLQSDSTGPISQCTSRNREAKQRLSGIITGLHVENVNPSDEKTVRRDNVWKSLKEKLANKRKYDPSKNEKVEFIGEENTQDLGEPRNEMFRLALQNPLPQNRTPTPSVTVENGPAFSPEKLPGKALRVRILLFCLVLDKAIGDLRSIATKVAADLVDDYNGFPVGIITRSRTTKGKYEELFKLYARRHHAFSTAEPYNMQLFGAFVLHTETTADLQEALTVFKEWNSDWTPSHFMVDKSNVEINALEEEFPGAPLKTHFYWCMARCGGDVQVLRDSLINVVQHYQIEGDIQTGDKTAKGIAIPEGRRHQRLGEVSIGAPAKQAQVPAAAVAMAEQCIEMHRDSKDPKYQAAVTHLMNALFTKRQMHDDNVHGNNDKEQLYPNKVEAVIGIGDAGYIRQFKREAMISLASRTTLGCYLDDTQSLESRKESAIDFYGLGRFTLCQEDLRLPGFHGAHSAALHFRAGRRQGYPLPLTPCEAELTCQDQQRALLITIDLAVGTRQNTVYTSSAEFVELINGVQQPIHVHMLADSPDGRLYMAQHNIDEAFIPAIVMPSDDSRTAITTTADEDCFDESAWLEETKEEGQQSDYQFDADGYSQWTDNHTGWPLHVKTLLGFLIQAVGKVGGRSRSSKVVVPDLHSSLSIYLKLYKLMENEFHYIDFKLQSYLATVLEEGGITKKELLDDEHLGKFKPYVAAIDKTRELDDKADALQEKLRFTRPNGVKIGHWTCNISRVYEVSWYRAYHDEDDPIEKHMRWSKKGGVT